MLLRTWVYSNDFFLFNFVLFEVNEVNVGMKVSGSGHWHLMSHLRPRTTISVGDSLPLQICVIVGTDIEIFRWLRSSKAAPPSYQSFALPGPHGYCLSYGVILCIHCCNSPRLRAWPGSKVIYQQLTLQLLGEFSSIKLSRANRSPSQKLFTFLQCP